MSSRLWIPVAVVATTTVISYWIFKRDTQSTARPDTERLSRRGSLAAGSSGNDTGEIVESDESNALLALLFSVAEDQARKGLFLCVLILQRVMCIEASHAIHAVNHE